MENERQLSGFEKAGAGCSRGACGLSCDLTSLSPAVTGIILSRRYCFLLLTFWQMLVTAGLLALRATGTAGSLALVVGEEDNFISFKMDVTRHPPTTFQQQPQLP